ncbi:MAG: ferrous iron transport protein B [Methanomassiliicoccales archaeon]
MDPWFLKGDVMEIGLIGQPNAGKSALFTKLTGIGAISSNYPGTTVEYQEGSVIRHGVRLNFHDLPGTYSLTGISEDEIVATKLLAERHLDCVLVVADANRLEQSLVLIFQILELGFKTVVALNQMDIARRRYSLNIDKLESILRVPVVPTVAITGEGVEELVEVLVSADLRPSDFKVKYDPRIESILQELGGSDESWLGKFPKRGALIKLLEGNPFFTDQFTEDFKAKVEEARRRFKEDYEEDIEVHINRDRYGEAGRIAREVISRNIPQRRPSERISDATLRAKTGIPILMGVLGAIFLTIVFLGGYLEGLLLDAYALIMGDFFARMAELIGGSLGQALANGLDLSLQAILAIVIPYIIVFYLLLGILEDTGYLPRMVVLLDGVMHRLGLHGKAIIPMIVGLGCNVPAILSTRVMESRRERLIIAVIIVIAVPCSAQTAVILGTVGNFAGLLYALAIYLILVSLLLMLGRLLHKVLKFEPTSLAMEIPDLRLPRPKNVLWKTWIRSKDFFLIAFPILLVGSLILEILMSFGILQAMVEPLAIFTEGFLGLPAVTIVALFFGILRKEMALQFLVILFGTADLSAVMTSAQLFVFALVMATYMPCLSALAAMSREFGLKGALTVTFSSMLLAFSLGGLANLILQLL